MRRDRSGDPPKTAEAFMRELLRDPEYLARRAARAKELRAICKANAESARPIVTELRAAGFPVEDVADLFNQRMNYKPAVSILLSWLQRTKNPDVKEDIVRALSVKWAKPAAAVPLLREFRSADVGRNPGLRWAIGNALEVVADDSVFDDLVKLVTDKRFGRDREMLAMALGKMKTPKAVTLLIELLRDGDVAGHAIIALGKLRARKARSAIEPFLEDPRGWVRKEARKALAKIDKAG